MTALTDEFFASGVPSTLRPFLLVDCVALPPEHAAIAEALWTSTKLMEPIIRKPFRLNIIFATTPFILELANMQMRIATKPDVINVIVNDVIFVDCVKLLPLPQPLKVACILEELVHGWLNLKDEGLTTEIVGRIYPGVVIVNGQYCARADYIV